MGNLEKGKSYEAEVRNELKNKGFEVWQPQWTRWGVKDILNRFDLIAYHPETRELFLVQCTSGAKSDWKRRVLKVEGFKPSAVIVQCLQKDGERYEAKYECSL